MTGLAVLLAGGIGAALRFVLDGAGRAWWPTVLPWPTIAINVSGSLLIGVLAGLVTGGADPAWALVLGTGFCGGFTTLSAASEQTVRLVQRGAWGQVLVSAVLTPVVATAAALLGLLLAR